MAKFNPALLEPLENEEVEEQPKSNKQKGFDLSLLEPVEGQPAALSKGQHFPKEAIELARQRLKGKAPDWFINMLMGEAVKEAENPERVPFGLPNPQGAFGAHVRKMRQEAFEIPENIVSAFGLPVNRQAHLPHGFHEQPEDVEHPLANFLGGAQSAGAIGGGLLKALHSVAPGIEKFSKQGILPYLSTATLEGAGLGGLMSPPGERPQGAVIGGGLGAGFGALGKLIGQIPGGIEWFKKYGSTKFAKNELARIEAELTNAKEKYAPESAEINQSYTDALGNLEKLKEKFTREHGVHDPLALIRKSEKAQEERAGHENVVNETPEELRVNEVPEHPQEPQLTELALMEREPYAHIAKNEIPKHEINEQAISEAEDLLQTAEQKHAAKEAEVINELGGKGRAFNRHVANKLNPLLEKQHQEVSNEYNDFTEGLKNENIALENPRDAKQIAKEIGEEFKKTKNFQSPEIQKLAQELETIGKQNIIPADKFVSAYRTMRKMARETRKSAYGKSQQEFDRLMDRANEMDVDVEKMKGIIDEGLGKDKLADLQKIDRRYATEVAPLFKNEFFMKMQKHSIAPGNMMENLLKEPFIKEKNPNKVTGGHILREIVKNDPELLRDVVGEQYAHKPQALHEWEENHHEFIKHMPELQKVRNEHYETGQNVQYAKQHLAETKKQVQQQKEMADKEHNRLQEERVEKNRLAKENAVKEHQERKREAHQENKRKKEEHREKVEQHEKMKKYHESKTRMNELDEKIKNLEEAAQHMKEAQANAKKPGSNAKLKHIFELEKKKVAINKELEKAKAEQRKVAKIVGGGLLGIIGTGTGTKIYNKFHK